MKNSIITPLLFLFFSVGFSQNLKIDFYGNHSPSIKKEKLNEAKLMRDVIPDYPTKWIINCVSAEISATCDGKAMVAMSSSDTLSTEQILNTVDPGTYIVINIKYKYKNSVNDNIEIDKMHFLATVIPETVAEYPGGYQQMIQYLKENTINKISETASKQFQQIIVRFTVNEQGEIAGVKMTKTSTDPKIDQLFLDAVNKMQKWKPAENSKGVKVKQEFEFSVGAGGGC